MRIENLRNGRRRGTAAINDLRLADYLRTRGSWVQILPGAPNKSGSSRKGPSAPFSFCPRFVHAAFAARLAALKSAPGTASAKAAIFAPLLRNDVLWSGLRGSPEPA